MHITTKSRVENFTKLRKNVCIVQGGLSVVSYPCFLIWCCAVFSAVYCQVSPGWVVECRVGWLYPCLWRVLEVLSWAGLLTQLDCWPVTPRLLDMGQAELSFEPGVIRIGSSQSSVLKTCLLKVLIKTKDV